MTSALGFGCAALFGGWETRRSLRLVDLAYDHGYRHFDVAPAYGLGMAEEVLGKALHGRRDKVSLTSKAGIGAPRHSHFLLAARQVLRPLKSLPFARGLGRGAYAAAAPRGRFDIESLERSLHHSLRALKTDHLDLFLLHEVWCEEINDALLTTLAKLRRDGKVLSLGTATSQDQTKLIRERFGAFFDVWQHSFDICEPRDRAFPPFTITHGSLHHAFTRLHDFFAGQPDMARVISDRLDMDIRNPHYLGRALIGACLAANTEGLTLVGSRQSQRISENAAVLHDSKWIEAGAELNQFLISPAGQSFLSVAASSESQR